MNREIKFRAWDGSKMQTNGDIILTASGEGGYHNLNDDISCIQEFDILMQYTGLKDRNGKEVYFKDIVKDPSGNYFVVEWYEQEMRIVLKRQDTLYGFNVPSYEVVGNVFENPELL